MMDLIIRSSHNPPFHREWRPVFLQLLSCNPAVGLTQVLLSSCKPISLTTSSSRQLTMTPCFPSFLLLSGLVQVCSKQKGDSEYGSNRAQNVDPVVAVTCQVRKQVRRDGLRQRPRQRGLGAIHAGSSPAASPLPAFLQLSWYHGPWQQFSFLIPKFSDWLTIKS